jgi:uncharacterized membrane protein
MAMLQVLFFGLPALSFALGIPLALRLVPPNRFYGFRTATSFSSLEAWYQINFATGLAMMAAGAAGGVLALLLAQGAIALKPEARYVSGILFTAAATAASLIPVAIYASKFGSE